jgi:hypothetical protein
MPRGEIENESCRDDRPQTRTGASMKVSYRGYPLLYFSIFRKSDGYEATSGYEDSAETIPDKIAQLRERVDNELAEDDPWMEHESGPLQP